MMSEQDPWNYFTSFENSQLIWLCTLGPWWTVILYQSGMVILNRPWKNPGIPAKLTLAGFSQASRAAAGRSHVYNWNSCFWTTNNAKQSPVAMEICRCVFVVTLLVSPLSGRCSVWARLIESWYSPLCFWRRGVFSALLIHLLKMWYQVRDNIGYGYKSCVSFMYKPSTIYTIESLLCPNLNLYIHTYTAVIQKTSS